MVSPYRRPHGVENTVKKVQGLLESKDTHRPGALGKSIPRSIGPS
jgi:hypothetical protein